MDSPDTSRPQYYCPVCGRGFSEKQAKYGVSVVREGDVYCHGCFTKTFPGECENHPGVKATRSCDLCEKMFCSNCLVEIQGKQICKRCKGRVLADLLTGPRKRVRTQSPVAILVAGMLGFFFCGIPALMAVSGYLRHRGEVERGLARKSIIAKIGFIIAAAWLVFYLILFVVFSLGTF